MKNEEAKQLLSAYRPSGDDASDPAFEEALEQARRDPELAAWFKEERARDARLARVFQSVPVPEEGRHSLLALARVKPSGKKRSFWAWTTALAASFAIAVGLTFLLMPYPRPAPDVALSQERSVGAAELLELAHAARPLDFRGDSVAELRAWLAGRGAPAPAGLPAALAAQPAVGCRVFADDVGNEISLLCLKKNGELVHLFVAEGVSREALALPQKTWVSHDGWNAYCWADGERAYVILSLAPREELEDLVI